VSNGGVVGYGLVDSVLSVVRIPFIQLDLVIVCVPSGLESFLETVIGCVVGSPCKDDTVCVLAVGDMK
jgi:hypothetical protein